MIHPELVQITLRAWQLQSEATALARKVGVLMSKETLDLAAIDTLNESVTALRGVVEGVGASVTALGERLSDNPTPEAVTAAAAELTALGSQLSGAKDAIDAIDPNVEGGIQPGDVEGGEAPA